MNLGDALRESSDILKTHNIQDSQIEARVLLGYILKMSPVELYTYPEHILDKDQTDKLYNLLNRRIRHEPLAYIIQNKEFYGLQFYVDNRVLIPRPETELLVEKALEFLTERTDHITTNNTINVADIGTGSGVVAICIATRIPGVKIYATDISKDALEVALYNSGLHNVTDRISFLKGSLLEPVEQPIDLLIANLPYILSQELPHLCSEISSYEPRIALDGGHDGLDKISELIMGSRDKIRHDSCIILEIGDNQAKQVTSIINCYLPNANFDILPDYNGLPRIAKIDLHG
jgi:release factor glutamine methyltransferase